MKKLKILKIGGSVITDKRKGVFEVLKRRKLREVCRAISDCFDDNLILIHGVGSFGHPYVEKYGIDATGVSITHLGCLKLTNIVCGELIELGVRAIPLSPLPFLSCMDCDAVEEDRIKLITEMLKDHYLPVLHGDIVFRGSKAEILSGDEVVMRLCNALPVKHAGFAIGAEGVMVNGELMERITRDEFLNLRDSMRARSRKKSDVTGGIIGKLEKSFQIRKDCRVFIFRGSYDNLVKFLRGERVGTEVVR